MAQYSTFDLTKTVRAAIEQKVREVIDEQIKAAQAVVAIKIKEATAELIPIIMTNYNVERDGKIISIHFKE